MQSTLFLNHFIKGILICHSFCHTTEGGSLRFPTNSCELQAPGLAKPEVSDPSFHSKRQPPATDRHLSFKGVSSSRVMNIPIR